MPELLQSPTLPQIVSVYTLIRFGRRIVAKGLTFTPEEAVEFRALMNRTSTVFELPDPRSPVDLMKPHDETISSLKAWVDNDTPAQAAVREAITSDMGVE